MEKPEQYLRQKYPSKENSSKLNFWKIAFFLEIKKNNIQVDFNLHQSSENELNTWALWQEKELIA